jgi:hypothetical protein
MKFCFGLLCTLLLVVSCDTASNFDQTNKKYFLKYYGNDGDQEGVDLVVNTDGSFYLLGTSDSKSLGKQVYLVKTGADGNILWEKTFGGKKDEKAKDLLQLSDGRLVFVANTFENGNIDVFVETLTADGNKIDSVIYPLSSKDEDALSITQTTDGFIVAGSTADVSLKLGGAQDKADVTDAMQLRFNTNLTIYADTWRKTVGYPNADVAVKIEQDDKGKFSLFGYSNKQLPTSSSQDFNYWITQLGLTGEPASNELFPGEDRVDELLTSVLKTPLQSGEGFLLAGQSLDPTSAASKLFLVKVRKNISLTSQDYLFREKTNIDLKTTRSVQYVNICTSQNSGYYVIANDNRLGVDNTNWYVSNFDNNGNPIWQTPVTFGGENNDTVGAISELPDGSILILGTMEVGGIKIREKKMTLIKVNSSGKFAN